MPDPRHGRRAPDPRISVYCRCGAQWHGRAAVDNRGIDRHAAGGPGCGLVSATAFVALGHRVRWPAHWHSKG